MARKARTDAPVNAPAVASTIADWLTDMSPTDVGTFATLKADGTVSVHTGTVLERMDTARGVRFRVQHKDGYAIVDPAYVILERSAFVIY